MADENRGNIEQLVALLSSADPDMRGMTAVALGKLGDAQAVAPLIGLLTDHDPRVRIAAIRSLGDIGDTAAVESLLPLLQDEAPEVRAAVVVALSQLPSPRSFSPIVVSLFDADDEVRRNAAAAIGKLDDPRALEPLLASLHDPYHWVRANAAWSLGQLRLAQATPSLITCFQKEEDEDVAANIIVALGRMAQAEAVEQVLLALTDADEKPKVRIAAAIAFPECDYTESQLVSARACLLDLLHTAQDDELRSTAAWTLGRIPRDEGTLAALTQALSDGYEWVERYAQESLALLEEA